MIDKIIPRYLDSDTDERLVEEGVMTDALNVGMFNTEGGVGVLQNAISTSAIQVESGAIGVSDDAVVIGSVSDAQRGFIYFFVKDTEDENLDGIYRYEASSNTYKRVFTHSWFGFRTQDTVQADVVTAAFQQDGNLQSIIYFTDGWNPPRKINIERALAGDYNGMSSSRLNIALSTIRAASTKPPVFRFDTDTNFTDNNFHRSSFQYATQIVYKDGEVSALSPYSKISVTPYTFYGAIEQDTLGVDKTENNVCIINHQVDTNHPDIKSVRILARETNDGNFFIVDEFNPSQNISRNVFSTTVNVYDAASKEYKFYNERIGDVIDAQTSNKLYDNVPLKAKGQAIAGNRLLFSNYTEGRPNHDVSATLSVNYSGNGEGYEKFISDADIANIFTYSNSPFKIEADLSQAALLNFGDTIPGGAIFETSFLFHPNMTVTDTSGLIRWNATSYNESTNQYAETTISSNIVNLHDGQEAGFSFSYINSQDRVLWQLADDIQALIDEQSVFVRYLADFTTNLSNSFTDIPVVVEFKFGETTSATADTLNFKPRIVNIYGDFDNGFDVNDFIFNINNIDYQPSSDEDFSDIYVNAGNIQSEAAYTSITNDPSGYFISLNSSSVLSTFKAGASHGFGVVYYDEWGRCGFVNELGSVYVKYPAERSTGDNKNGASININFGNETAPDWADSYQIVYNESSVSNNFQYTVGGAYVARKYSLANANERDIDTTNHNIYVSLKTLDFYKRDKDVVRDYSFTEGDKLRVVSCRNSSDTLYEYNLSSTNKIIEFDVVGVVQDPEDLIHIGSHSESDVWDQDPHQGTFLILSAPSVDSTVSNTGNVNKYVGFDWYQLTGTNYNTTDTVSAATNYWNRQVIVDIVTPKKTTEQSIYYEIGERRRIGTYKDSTLGEHGPIITTNSGNFWYRPVACKTPIHDASWISLPSNDENPDGWLYKYEYLEDQNITDLYESKDWNKGRAHVTYKNAATINRFNGVTWSDPYEEDVSILSLSSFTPSTANFFSYESRFGAVNYLANFRSDLLAIQDNRMSIAPVSKEFLNYADGSSDVVISNNVIGTPQYAAGDYGIGNDTASALVYDGQAFFVDRSRRKVLRYAGGQLEPISDKGLSSLFADKISNSSSKLISGYDPGEDMYYVTIAGSPGTTVGYNVALGKWQSKYSFVPDCYSLLNDVMFSFKSADISSVKHIMHSHDGATRLNFYGTSYSSEVSVVSKYSPDSVKVFNALSLHSDEAWSAQVTSDLGQDTGDGNMSNSTFSEKEGVWYRNITGNNVVKYTEIGTATDGSSGSTLVFSNKLIGMSIPIGENLYRWVTNAWGDTGIPISSVNASERKVIGSTNISSPSGYRFATKSKINHVEGDRIRGHYAKIKLTNSSISKVELFSVSAHISNSPLNHALGQQ